MELLAHLRNATEDDVALALDCAMIELPATAPAELLEFYKPFLDPDRREAGRNQCRSGSYPREIVSSLADCQRHDVASIGNYTT